MKDFTSLGADSWLQGRRLLPILRRHGEGEDGAVLDLGCGHSPFRGLFPQARRFVRFDRQAVDPEVVVVSDVTALPLASGEVNAIIASRMLGDLPDIVTSLRELNRVLAPGGKVLVYESISYPQHDLPHDYWRVLPGGLQWAAERAGFQVTELEYLGGYFTQLAMHWNNYIVGAFGSYAVTKPLVWIGRCGCNLLCRALDRLMPRPTLATDYFACLVKPQSATDQGRP